MLVHGVFARNYPNVVISGLCRALVVTHLLFYCYLGLARRVCIYERTSLANKCYLLCAIEPRPWSQFGGLSSSDVNRTPPSMGQIVCAWRSRLERLFDNILISIYVDMLWSQVTWIIAFFSVPSTMGQLIIDSRSMAPIA